MRLAPSSYKQQRSGVREMMERSWARDDVIHLEVGESGLETASHIIEAAAEASRRGENGYSPTPGLPRLRAALADKLRQVNGHEQARAENILVTNGGGNALYVVFASILDDESSILLPDPGWASFPLIAHAVGGRAQFYRVREENEFLPDPEEIRGLITDKTRALVVNSPSNPLGKIIPGSLAQEIYQLCCEHDLWLISDECYDQIDFSGNFFSFGAMEATSERIISVFSFSKVYAMTGWRLGYCHLPAELVDPVLSILEPTILCVNTPAQYAALAALQGEQQHLAQALGTYRNNRDRVMSGLEHSSFQVLKPDGGFYAWLKIKKARTSSEEVAIELLEKHGVVVTPGTAFGASGEGYLRISIATSPEQLEEGIQRLLAY